MNIHTVREGEGIFDIARSYLKPPSKIIEENDLDADRLVKGQELLILTPTRSFTVRGGDTLGGICHKFGIKKKVLVRNNPYLWQSEALRPGQILTVKLDAPSLGSQASLGFYHRGCSNEKLMRAMPHLTYLCICSAEIKGERAYHFFPDSQILEYARTDGKISLLGIEDVTEGEFLEHKESVIESVLALAKRGYKGVYLRAPEAARRRRKEFCEFLFLLRKRFIGCDLILFSEVADDGDKDASDLSDGGDLISTDSSVLERYAEGCESGKTFIRLPTHATIEGGPFTDVKSALGIAYRTGSHIERQSGSDDCFFRYKRYKKGEGVTETVSFPSLFTTRAKMALAAELGYMGFSFDISSMPVSYLAMLNSEFSRADYSLVLSAGI